MMNKIILASQSPRRKQLLEWAEVDFEVIVHSTDESFPEGLAPQDVAVHIANEKAKAVQNLFNEKIIVAADTIVVLDNEIIGKPKDREDALLILNKLSGRHHQVITGVSIINMERRISFSDTTD